MRCLRMKIRSSKLKQSLPQSQSPVRISRQKSSSELSTLHLVPENNLQQTTPSSSKARANKPFPPSSGSQDSKPFLPPENMGSGKLFPPFQKLAIGKPFAPFQDGNNNQTVETKRSESLNETEFVNLRNLPWIFSTKVL